MIGNSGLVRNARTLEATLSLTDRGRLVGEVSRMVGEWERSDELATEFAGRLVDYFARKFDISSAKGRD